MKAVIPNVPDAITEWRRRNGADRWDEMWEGVLHMPPMPNRVHQDLEGAMEAYLRRFWIGLKGGKVYHQINLASPGAWPSDYRVPDLVLLTPDRFGIDKNEYFEGAPTVVVEIRSPEDESYDKLDFYATLGVPEVWIIDRDTKAPEIYALVGGAYEKRDPDADGWVKSKATDVEIRRTESSRLAMRVGGDGSTLEEMP